MSITIIIAGAAGRMGRALIHAARTDVALRIVGAVERPDSPHIGSDAGVLADGEALGLAISAAPTAAADVWIDFTNPAAALSALSQKPARAAVIGATGFSDADEALLRERALETPIVRAGNFSLGVNLLAALVEQAAARLGPAWDIEILETHHRHKLDAPSGTALLLGEAAASGRQGALSALKLPPRDGVTGARPAGGIGFAVQRAGGFVGEHEVTFASEREALRLMHQGFDRAIYADGALAAAKWCHDKAPGLYSMRDVLGL